MIISGYSISGKTSIEKWERTSNEQDYSLVWTTDIDSPSFVDYTEDCLIALSAGKKQGRLHYLEKEGQGYKKKDELELEVMGLCHVFFMEKEGLVLASSYHEGVLVVAKINQGKFEKNPRYIRQEAGEDGLTRIHCGISNQDETLVYATNIATDKIYVYQVKDRDLVEYKVIDVKKNCGPRHLVIDEERSRLYVMTEYSCEVIEIEIGQDDYRVVNYHRTLPIGYQGQSDGAAIDMSPDKKFLYVTNRGHDSIACFSIDGEVELLQIYENTGDWPRHMSVISDTLLGVANRRENMVELIARNPETGKLIKRVKTFDFIEPSYVK